MKTCLPSKTIAVLAALLLSLPCRAVDLDGASIEAGSGRKVSMLRLGLQSNWDSRWWQSNGSYIGGYWDATIAQWRGTAYRQVSGQRLTLASIGLVPVFRFQGDDRKGWYAEGGIGIELLSRLYNNDGHMLSTAFQFDDRIGAGYVFSHGWDVGLRLEHVSNGGIKKPNKGANFVQLRVARQF